MPVDISDLTVKITELTAEIKATRESEDTWRKIQEDHDKGDREERERRDDRDRWVIYVLLAAVLLLSGVRAAEALGLVP